MTPIKTLLVLFLASVSVVSFILFSKSTEQKKGKGFIPFRFREKLDEVFGKYFTFSKQKVLDYWEIVLNSARTWPPRIIHMVAIWYVFFEKKALARLKENIKMWINDVRGRKDLKIGRTISTFMHAVSHHKKKVELQEKVEEHLENRLVEEVSESEVAQDIKSTEDFTPKQ